MKNQSTFVNIAITKADQCAKLLHCPLHVHVPNPSVIQQQVQQVQDVLNDVVNNILGDIARHRFFQPDVFYPDLHTIIEVLGKDKVSQIYHDWLQKLNYEGYTGGERKKSQSEQSDHTLSGETECEYEYRAVQFAMQHATQIPASTTMSCPLHPAPLHMISMGSESVQVAIQQGSSMHLSLIHI